MELSPEVAVAHPNPSEQNATPTAVSRPATAVIEDVTRSNKKAKKDGDIRSFGVVLPPANKALALDTPPASASVRPPVTWPLPFHSGPVSMRMTHRRRVTHLNLHTTHDACHRHCGPCPRSSHRQLQHHPCPARHPCPAQPQRRPQRLSRSAIRRDRVQEPRFHLQWRRLCLRRWWSIHLQRWG